MPSWHARIIKKEYLSKADCLSKTRIYTAGLHYNTSHIQMYTVFEKRGQIYKLKIDKMDTFFETGGMLLAVFYFDRN